MKYIKKMLFILICMQLITVPVSAEAVETEEQLFSNSFEAMEPFYLDADGKARQSGEDIHGILGMNISVDGTTSTKLEGAVKDYAYTGERSLLVSAENGGGVYSDCVILPDVLYAFGATTKPYDGFSGSLKLIDLENSQYVKIYNENLTSYHDLSLDEENGGVVILNENADWITTERILFTNSSQNISPKLSWVSNETSTFKYYMDSMYLKRVFNEIDGKDTISLSYGQSAVENYKPLLSDDSHIDLIQGISWEIDGGNSFVTINDNGVLSVSADSPAQVVNLKLTITTFAGEEVLYKEVKIEREKNDYDISYYDFEIDNPVYKESGHFTEVEPGAQNLTFINQYGTKIRWVSPNQSHGSQFYGLTTDDAVSGSKSASVSFGGWGGGLGVKNTLEAGTIYYFSSYIKGDSTSSVSSRSLAFLPMFSGTGTMNGTQLFVYNPSTTEFVDQSKVNCSNTTTTTPSEMLTTVTSSDTEWQKFERVFYVTDNPEEHLGLGFPNYSTTGMKCYVDDIYTGKMFRGIDGADTITVTENNTQSTFSIDCATDGYDSIMKSVTWEIEGNPNGFSIEDGVLTISDKVRTRDIVISAEIETEVGTETVTKTVSIVNDSNAVATAVNTKVFSTDFEIENPEYEYKTSGETTYLYSISGLSLYMTKRGVGSTAGNNYFQELTTDAAHSGAKSIPSLQNKLGGYYPVATYQPKTLYVYSMWANPMADTADVKMRLTDLSETNGDRGITLYSYAPDLSETEYGYLWNGNVGATGWDLKAENAGKWEKVERVFYSDTDSPIQRFITMSVPSGNPKYGIEPYKYYMDDLYIGRVFTGIAGDSHIDIPNDSYLSRKYDVLCYNDSYKALVTEKQWKVYSETDDVTIDSSGNLIVPSTAPQQTVTIELTVKTTVGEEVFYKDVELIKKENADILCRDLYGKEINFTESDFTVEIHVTNHNDELLNYYDIVALYDEATNSLKEILAYVPQQCDANSEKTTTHTINISDLTEDCYVKVMVWDENMSVINEYKLLGKPVRDTFYVAKNGSDENDGSEDAPFLTLDRAKQEVATLKRNGAIKSGGITINIKEGTYYLSDSFELTEEHSGEENAPIVWQSYGNDNVVISGGIQLNSEDFTKVPTDSAVLEKIYETTARDKIYKIDLSAYGITDIPEVPHYGRFQTTPERYSENFTSVTGSAYELFLDSNPLTVASWPNNGEYAYFDYADVVNPDTCTSTENLQFRYENDRISNWLNVPEAKIYGFWGVEWADWSVNLVSYEDGVVGINSEATYLSSTHNDRRFRAYNLIQELDTDGEYYIDRGSNTLYYCSDTDMTGKNLSLSLTDTSLFNISGSNIIVRGLKFGETRGSAVTISGSDNLVEKCEMSGMPGRAVSISGFRNGIKSCYIHDVNNGVSLSGGDRNTLTPGENYVENCVITRYDRLTKPLTNAVTINGVGNIVSHNEIFDAEQVAIEIYGNNHLVEYNDIHDVCLVADDVGFIYAGQDTTYRGNRILNNYLHDSGARNNDNGTEEVTAIYFDDQMSNGIVKGNVIENIVWRGITIGGGRNHIIEDNEFINVGRYVTIANRNAGVDYGSLASSDSRLNLVKKLNAVPYQSTVWYNYYPELYNILDYEQEDLGAPRYITVKNNKYMGVTDTGITTPSNYDVWEYGVYENNQEITERTVDTSNMGLSQPSEVKNWNE